MLSLVCHFFERECQLILSTTAQLSRLRFDFDEFGDMMIQEPPPKGKQGVA